MIIIPIFFQYFFPYLINSLFVRAIISFILSIGIALFLNKKMIFWNDKKKHIREHIRDIGIIGQKEKEGTPTMGGIIIIISALIPTVIFSIFNIYIIILIITTLWMGLIGFIDDYIKIKYHKNGLSVFGKILGQIILGIFIGTTMSFHKKIFPIKELSHHEYAKKHFYKKEDRFKTTLPIFSKKKEFNYTYILSWYNKQWKKYVWIIFIPIVVIIIISVSNGANLTDGIDGLTAGISSIIFVTLSIFTFLSSKKIYSDYFHCIYIPNIGEILIFSFSFLGSLIGFLWYNIYPAKIFMGDTGSLTIGSVISVISIILKKELIIPILCGIFLIENLSVIVQVWYFKYSKKKYGIGKRIFLMAPLHHHFQMIGYHENKIFNFFFILQMILSIVVFILIII
ncbi:phospho-N-acetylmuramoyl-pentapeptide-transferase [Blattabacterium cuenoti]|uniref:phospho-N-acetylmuramoyl-pentapeptide- transferase n=1 Tax=Blattabacterium cuenoti TaxID=1653831 RepID=UPI00163D3B93|nr:phospho-N-acetylmuramoyl-pentapeptide-transferase [Blattabacterium cuenoti]